MIILNHIELKIKEKVSHVIEKLVIFLFWPWWCMPWERILCRSVDALFDTLFKQPE